MGDSFDAVILGGGHNALVVQAYLSRSGLRTLLLERAAAPGGGLVTFENPRWPGFIHHPHSFFHRGITAMPWFRDLELARHGVRYLEPELNVAMILADGPPLEWWTDFEKTFESFAQFSQPDAQSLRRWVEEFRPIVENILVPEAQSPPCPAAQRLARLQQSPQGRRLLEVSARSPLQFVLEEFKSDVIRAGLLFFNGLREVDLRLPGFGHSIPALLASPHKAQMCVGGSQNLARGLLADIAAHGGQIRCGVTLDRLLVGQGRVCGVRLESGEELRATGLVVSGLNPQQTFLDLLPADAVAPEVRKAAAGFQYNLLAPLFAVHVALECAPAYAAAQRHAQLDRAFMVILGLERFQQFEEIVRAHEQGRLPPTVAWGACPTLFDPTQAPAGKHTAFLWEKVPYALGGNPAQWTQTTTVHGRELMNFWADYAPNLEGKNVLDCFFQSPLETVERLPNLAQGDLLAGAFAHGQVGYDRPFPGAGQYRAPVPGLYLCGGSTHPGGNIHGLCGYNAAQVIAADLGLKGVFNHLGTETQRSFKT